MDMDIRPLLSALLDHVTRHPHLSVTFTGISGYQPSIQPSGTLEVLAAWVRTLDEIGPVEVHVYDKHPGVNLNTTGNLVGGMRVRVGVAIGETEADLLAVNTRIEQGDEIPLELLLRLTSAADAEAVARG